MDAVSTQIHTTANGPRRHNEGKHHQTIAVTINKYLQMHFKNSIQCTTVGVPFFRIVS